MINQWVKGSKNVLGQPIMLADTPNEKPLNFQPATDMITRAAKFSAKSRYGAPNIIATEYVGNFIVNVPKSTARQRNSLITYSVEDNIAVPIDTVTVVQGPLKTKTSGTALALVVSKDILAQFDDLEGPLLPEFLLIPRPVSQNIPCWAVWKSGTRVVIRSSDGTGFAAAASMLPDLWVRAGKPELHSFGEPLGDNLPVQDMSDAPPPDPLDLAFSFERLRKPNGDSIKYWRIASMIIITTLLLQVGLMVINTNALRAVAASERSKAERAIATSLPSVPVTRNVNPILARLSHPSEGAVRATFLPLLRDVTTALQDITTPISFRRLAWGKDENILVVLVQGAGLNELQQVQQTLEIKGFAVRSGAADAGNGGAEVEMRISRKGGG